MNKVFSNMPLGFLEGRERTLSFSFNLQTSCFWPLLFSFPQRAPETKLDKQCPLEQIVFLKTMEWKQIFVDIYLFLTYFLPQYQSPYSGRWTFS